MTRKLCLVALLSLMGLLGESKAAWADNHYPLVGIDNPTSVTITYHFKWGADADYVRYTLAPGQRRWHSWEYDYANENRSPIPYIRFDSDLSSAVLWEEFRLKAYAAPCESYDFAKKYFFRRSPSGMFLNLLESYTRRVLK